MEEYRMTLEDWLESNTILEFKSAVSNAVESVEADPTTGQCLVILKMHHGWLSVTMKNLQKLLTYLFGSSIFNKLAIKLRRLHSSPAGGVSK